MNFQDIIDSESQMMEDAKRRYGEFFDNSFDFIILLQDFIADAKLGSWIFIIMLSHVRKHAVLAFFSIIRRHQIQGFMDLRQVLEGLSIACYALGHTDLEQLAKIDDDHVIQEIIKGQHYSWLVTNYPEASKVIKTAKDQVNATCSHANLTYAVQDFKLTEKSFEFSFFDRDDADLIKGNLWFVGYVCMHVMDIIFRVNKDHKLLNFLVDYPNRLKALEIKLNELKDEMLKKNRFSQYLPILEKNITS